MSQGSQRAPQYPPTRESHSQRSVQDREVRISKFLTMILRHGAKEMGVYISPDGWVSIPEILKLQHCKDLQLTEDEILAMVKSNDKQRFSTKIDSTSPPNPTTYIKANQGHSMEEVYVELTRIINASDYPIVVHGTYYKFWGAIQKTGLSKMRRNHIHMAIGEYGSASVISGMRSSCEIMIYIDIAQAIQDGIEFFISPNKVVLSSGVDGYLYPKYFEKVIDVVTKQKLDIGSPTEKEKIPEKIASEKKIEAVVGAYFDPKYEKKFNKKAKKPAATKGEGSQTPLSKENTDSSSTTTTTKSEENEGDEGSDSLKKSKEKGGKKKKSTKTKEEVAEESSSPIPASERTETNTTTTIASSTIAEPEKKLDEPKKGKQQAKKNKSRKQDIPSTENPPDTSSTTTTTTITSLDEKPIGEVVDPKKKGGKKNKSKKDELTEESSPQTPEIEEIETTESCVSVQPEKPHTENKNKRN